MTKSHIDKIEQRLGEMIVKADGQRTVTVADAKRSCRVKACDRTILDKLHERNIYMRIMREKPILTEQDIVERYDFANKGKRASYWTSHIHLHMDCKLFKVCLNQKARSYIKRARVKGAYRKPGQGLDQGYTKPPKKLKFTTGAKGVHVLAGVGQKKVLLWHYLDTNWCGKVAAEAYRGPVAKALKKTYPLRTTFNVLEDNDPTGFQSKKGLKAKEEVKINEFAIPKRSPCLNVCDYALWDEVNRCMREQEARWKGKKDTREEFLERLRKTAFSLPESVVKKMVQGMKPRCERLYTAKGGNIEEGVKKKQL